MTYLLKIIAFCIINLLASCKSSQRNTKPSLENGEPRFVKQEPSTLRKSNFSILRYSDSGQQFIWARPKSVEPGLLYQYKFCGLSKGESTCSQNNSFEGSTLIPPVFDQIKTISLSICQPRKSLLEKKSCSKPFTKNLSTEPLSTDPDTQLIWQRIELLKSEIYKKSLELYQQESNYIFTRIEKIVGLTYEEKDRSHALGPDLAPLLYNAYLYQKTPPNLSSNEQSINLTQTTEVSKKSDTEKSTDKVTEDEDDEDEISDKEQSLILLGGQTLTTLGIVTIALSGFIRTALSVVQNSTDGVLEAAEDSLREVSKNQLELELKSKELSTQETMEVVSRVLDEIEKGGSIQNKNMMDKLSELTDVVESYSEQGLGTTYKASKVINGVERAILADTVKTSESLIKFTSEYAAQKFGVNPNEFDSQQIFKKSKFFGRDTNTILIRYRQKNDLKPSEVQEFFKSTQKYAAAQPEDYDQFHSGERVSSSKEIEMLVRNDQEFSIVDSTSESDLNRTRGAKINGAVYIQDSGNYYKMTNWIEVSDKKNIFEGGESKPLSNVTGDLILSKKSRDDIIQAYERAIRKLNEASVEKTLNPNSPELKEFQSWGKGILLTGEVDGEFRLIEPPDLWKTNENWKSPNVPEGTPKIFTKSNLLLNDKPNKSIGGVAFEALSSKNPALNFLARVEATSGKAYTNWAYLAKKQKAVAMIREYELNLRDQGKISQSSFNSPDIQKNMTSKAINNILNSRVQDLYQGVDTNIKTQRENIEKKANSLVSAGSSKIEKSHAKQAKLNRKTKIGFAVGSALLGTGLASMYVANQFELVQEDISIKKISDEIQALHAERIKLLASLLKLEPNQSFPDWVYLF